MFLIPSPPVSGIPVTSVDSPSKLHAETTLFSLSHPEFPQSKPPFTLYLRLLTGLPVSSPAPSWALLLRANGADQVTLLPSNIHPGIKSELSIFFLTALQTLCLCLVLSISPLLIWLQPRWPSSWPQSLKLLLSSEPLPLLRSQTHTPSFKSFVVGSFLLRREAFSALSLRKPLRPFLLQVLACHPFSP